MPAALIDTREAMAGGPVKAGGQGKVIIKESKRQSQGASGKAKR